jgi:signal transduction histidine kinase
VEHGSTGNQTQSGGAVEHGSTDNRTQSGDAITVRVGLLEGGFYVADDGEGIDDSDREQVFEMGYTDAADGTGFGLSIVAGIAEAHGWSCSLAESRSGGARFEFETATLHGDENRHGLKD